MANNCTYVVVPQVRGYQQYPGAPCVLARIYLVAKWDIDAGEELFAWCGDDLAADIAENFV